MLLERERIEGLDALPGIGPTLARRSRRWSAPAAGPSSSACAARSRPNSYSSRSRGSGRSLLVGSTRIWMSIRWKPSSSRRTTAVSNRSLASARAGGDAARDDCRGARAHPSAPRAARGRARDRSAPGCRPRVPGEARARRSAKNRAAALQSFGQAWLPILHTERDDWQFTALFSNTARAHELGQTADWVGLYFSKHNRAEGQRTVVRPRPAARSPATARFEGAKPNVLRGLTSCRRRREGQLGQRRARNRWMGARGHVASYRESVAVGSISKPAARWSRPTTSSSLSCRKSS